MNWTSAVLLQLSAILWTAAPFSTYNLVGGGSGSRLSNCAQKYTRCEEHRSSCYCSSSSTTLISTEDDIKATADAKNTVSILPARQPLWLPQSSSVNCKSFSLLSWNILLPNSKDNWWCHKQYSSNTPMSARQWPHRHSLIKDRILQSNADIVCIQEADGETFDQDFEFMKIAGFDHVLHRKFRFRCATFYKRDQFTLENEAHKDRALVTALRSKSSEDTDSSSKIDGKDTEQQETEDNILHIINCHLSGGAAPERRLRQVHDGLDQIRKWNNAIQLEHTKYKKQGKRQAKNIARTLHKMNEYKDCGIIVCGDFNSDGNTAVRKLLVDGYVDSDWYEPQYPTLQLTSKRKEQKFGTFIDAAELAWNGNVCDGDYSELHSLNKQLRPATYVVPNLASLLLKPVSQEQGPHRTQFGLQIAQGLATTLSLKDFCQSELDAAFDTVDEDKNGILDQDEVLTLLESAYVSTYGETIVQERNNFFRGFGKHQDNADGLTKDQFISRLKALQKDAEGERKAYGLAKGLNLKQLSEADMEASFNSIDLDGNGLLDEEEFQLLLEDTYLTIYGEEIEQHREDFFSNFQSTSNNDNANSELTREQFTERLLALYQELEGGRTGSELAEVRTDADAKKVVERFTPLLVEALDFVFEKFSSNGSTLTQDEVNKFLILTNGELGRGGTFRHTTALFKRKIESSSENVELTKDDWYSVFARELSEGKWWQVVYDLDICGFNIRSHHTDNKKTEFYQGWLDYIYFQRLDCSLVQDVLTEEERVSIYEKGDALPNEWHPSDHLPVAAEFSWRK